MLIRLLREHDHAFGPDEIPALVAAYEDTLAELGLVNRDDPATLLETSLGPVLRINKRSEGLGVRTTPSSPSGG
jgi:hypothetical protein